MGLGTTLRIAFNSTAVQRGLKGIASSIGNLSKQFAQIGVGIAAAGFAALTAAMVAFTISSSGAAAEMEGVRAQLDLFTGSVENTDDLLTKLRKTAAESPLEMTAIADGARNLLTYGVAAGEVADRVENLSEVSAGSAERFDRLAYAYGQISSIGRLMGTELRQLTEAGFNPLESISKRTGESMLDLKKRMENGGVSVDEVRQSLIDATSEGGRFYGMNDKMSKTFTGRVSMMKDQWNLLKISLGEGMNEGLKVAIDAITDALPQMMAKFKEIGVLIGSTIAEAVNGDTTRLFMVGSMIGEAIGSGMKVAMKAAMFEVGGNVLTWSQAIFKSKEEYAKLLNETDSLGVAYRKSMMDELTGSLRMKYNEAMGYNSPVASAPVKPDIIYSGPAAPDPVPVFVPDGMMEVQKLLGAQLKINEKIAHNTAGGAKM